MTAASGTAPYPNLTSTLLCCARARESVEGEAMCFLLRHPSGGRTMIFRSFFFFSFFSSPLKNDRTDNYVILLRASVHLLTAENEMIRLYRIDSIDVSFSLSLFDRRHCYIEKKKIRYFLFTDFESCTEAVNCVCMYKR